VNYRDLSKGKLLVTER